MAVPAAVPIRDHHESHRKAYLSLGIGVFGIGWSAILVRWSGVPGTVSAFYRLAFAAMVFLPWHTLLRRRFGSAPRAGSGSARGFAIAAGVFFAADLAFFNSSIMMTNAANATLIGVNAPIFVAFGTWMIYGRRPSAKFWIGFALAFAGMIAIVGTDVILHPSFGIGDLLALAGALFYGAYLLAVERSRASMDTMTFSVWCVATGALCLLPVCLLLHLPLGGFDARSWAALIGLALVTQILGHLLVAHALGHLPATRSSIVLIAQAPLTALLAWPLLGEPIRAGQILGGALVLGGIFVVNRGQISLRERKSVGAD